MCFSDEEEEEEEESALAHPPALMLLPSMLPLSLPRPPPPLLLQVGNRQSLQDEVERLQSRQQRVRSERDQILGSLGTIVERVSATGGWDGGSSIVQSRRDKPRGRSRGRFH